MIIASPASYISAAYFRQVANDYDLSSYSPTVGFDPIADLLVRVSGIADSIMRKTYLATEKVIRYEGDGTNKLDLQQRPVIYVKKVQIVIPGTVGPLIPIDQLLIDYEAGQALEYTPMIWEGQGYFARFPLDVPVDVTVGYGYGYTVAQPTWSYVDTPASGLAPGSYDVAVTAKTPWGETTATPQTITIDNGAALITIAPVLGAYLYRAYIAPHGTAPLKFAAESPATTYGSSSDSNQILVSSLVAPYGYWQDTLPTVDTSAFPVPAAIQEATRLLALSSLYEQNNLANRGVYKTESGRKSLTWKSTEGGNDKGVPLFYNQAVELLTPYKLLAIY